MPVLVDRSASSAPSGSRVLLPLALIITFLAGFTDVKIADVQGVEVAVIGSLALSLLDTRARLRISGPAVVIGMIPYFLALLGLVFIVSLFSMRLHFYPIPDTGFLKQPPWTTFARLFEIGISGSAMFIVALAIGTQPEYLKKLLACYIWAAYAGAIWGIISLFGWLAGIELPGATAGTVPRICGFFNEGGPFGLYLVGALLIQIVRYQYLHYIPARNFWLGSTLLFVALLGAQSKASIILALFLVAVFMFVTRRFSVLLVLAPLAVPFIMTSGVIKGVDGYIESRERFAVLAFTNPEDYNLVMGRVMASVLLPRIIEAHPVLGIGIGNYSLVRNDPALLRGLPQVDRWDLQGLGLLGYMAELGIPLTLYVMFLYFRPFRLALHTRPWIAVLGIYPLGAALFGVQLNFTYPWIVMGLVLAAIAIHENGARPNQSMFRSKEVSRGNLNWQG